MQDNTLRLLCPSCCRYARKTPIVCAAILGNASMIRTLAAGKVDVKRGGYDALLEACQHRQSAACLALLALGAPALPDTAGATARTIPLSIASFNGMQVRLRQQGQRLERIMDALCPQALMNVEQCVLH